MSSKLLTLKTLKHHWALVPVVAICGGACVMCATYVGFMCLTKSDLSFHPRSWNTIAAPYQGTDPLHIKKFFTHQRKHEVDPEIEALKRELGSYKS
jgi:hypothetical protein